MNSLTVSTLVVGTLVSLTVVIRNSLAVAVVYGNSMSPAIMNGQRVLISRLWPRGRLPVGDVVAVRPPWRYSALYIKRIAFRGECCCWWRPRRRQRWLRGDRALATHSAPTVVGLTHVRGDFPGSAYDSRVWGPLLNSQIVGRVVLVWGDGYPIDVADGRKIGWQAPVLHRCESINCVQEEQTWLES